LFKTVHLDCHQQRFFTLKMHKNRWRLGLRPKPHCGCLHRSTDPLAGLLLRGGEKERSGREANGKKGEVTGGEGRDFGSSQCWKQIDAPGARACATNNFISVNAPKCDLLSLTLAGWCIFACNVARRRGAYKGTCHCYCYSK